MMSLTLVSGVGGLHARWRNTSLRTPRCFLVIAPVVVGLLIAIGIEQTVEPFISVGKATE